MHFTPIHPNAGIQYPLQVTIGDDDHVPTHQIAHVNGPVTTVFGMLASANVAVKIQNYNTPDFVADPPTSAYFDHPLHKGDKVSIALSIVFDSDVNGNDLVFGNYFSHSIEEKIPKTWNTMSKFTKRKFEKSIEYNLKGSTSSIYSPALSSMSQFRIGVESPLPAEKLNQHTLVLEGSDTEIGQKVRNVQGIPDNAADRKEFFHDAKNRENFCFFGGVQYFFDFANAELNSTDLCLNLPGYDFPFFQIMDDPNHELRYALKNRATGEVYLVVVLSVAFRNGQAAALRLAQE
ncbi:hypothetical protein N7490_005674, partial [Penicillium lividum]